MSRRAKIWIAVAVIVLLGAAGIVFTHLFSHLNERNAARDDNAIYTEAGSKILKAGDYDIWLTVPDSWEVRETDNLDFSCRDDDLQLGMFVFDSGYLYDTTPLAVFIEQNYRLFQNRNNVKMLSSRETLENGKHITSEFYTAQREGYEENQYNTYLVEFDDSDLFVWVCINGLPEDVAESETQIDSIMRSITTEN
ncbi:MAG: hypothetical protein ACI4JF_09565 [Oscillospiraceae bacterium]